MSQNMKKYKMKIIYVLCYILATIYYSEACSSRSIPKPRPSSSSSSSSTKYMSSSASVGAGTALPNSRTAASSSGSSNYQTSPRTSSTTTFSTTTTTTTTTTTPRPNITFPTYKCPANYDAWYCLNEATCFSVKIGDSIMYNCECAIGFMGPRCEYKEIDGSYLPKRPRPILEKASIASGATCALLFMLFIVLTLYMRNEYRAKILEGYDDEDAIINDDQGDDEDCCDDDDDYLIDNTYGDKDNTIYYAYRDEAKYCRHCNDKRCCGNAIGVFNVNDDNYHRLRHNSSNASSF